MMKLWKQVLVGTVVVTGVAAAVYFWAPGRALAGGMMGNGGMMSGMMSEMMSGGMMSGDMGAMMQNMGKMHGTMTGAHAKELTAAAQALGISETDLEAAVAAGKDIATLAKEKGVDAAKVTEAVLVVRKAALQELVTSGTLTQDQADQMLQMMSQNSSMLLGGAGVMQSQGGCHGSTTTDV